MITSNNQIIFCPFKNVIFFIGLSPVLKIYCKNINISNISVSRFNLRCKTGTQYILAHCLMKYEKNRLLESIMINLNFSG